MLSDYFSYVLHYMMNSFLQLLFIITLSFTKIKIGGIWWGIEHHVTWTCLSEMTSFITAFSLEPWLMRHPVYFKNFVLCFKVFSCCLLILVLIFHWNVNNRSKLKYLENLNYWFYLSNTDRRSKLISAPTNFNHISHMGPGDGIQRQRLIDLTSSLVGEQISTNAPTQYSSSSAPQTRVSTKQQSYKLGC